MDTATFPDHVLERWRDEREVRVETSAQVDAPAHRTISYRGATARWYREAIATHPSGRDRQRRDRVPVRFESVADEGRIAACSGELARKYAGDLATAAMLRDEVLDTTLELRPIGS